MTIQTPQLIYPPSGTSFSFNTTQVALWAKNLGSVSDVGNLLISGCGSATCYLRCWCTRWDESNYNVTIETFLNSSDRDILFSAVVPGAVRELYNILGRPHFIDTTYTSGNTLKIMPSGNLTNTHSERLIAVKSISDSPFKGPSGYISIKIEGVRLDI